MTRRALLVLFVLLGLLAGAASVASAHPETCDQDGDNHFECDSENRGTRPLGDNCASVRNPDQTNTDRDEFGDACDSDDDGDGHADTADNCSKVANPGQEDANGDGIGDACAGDTDKDGVDDRRDNCLRDQNPDQADLDDDGVGDRCDVDDDGDGIPDDRDNCPAVSNEDQTDRDGDRIGTVCDPGEGVGGDGGGDGGGGGGGGPAGGDGGGDGGAGGGGGDPGGGGGDPSRPADRTAPSLGVALAATLRAGDLEGGMPTRVRCSEACAVTAELRVSAATAKRLRLGRALLARGTATLAGAGRTWVFVRPRAAVRRRVFARRGRTVRARLVVSAVDAAGNVRKTTKRVRLRG